MTKTQNDLIWCLNCGQLPTFCKCGAPYGYTEDKDIAEEAHFRHSELQRIRKREGKWRRDDY